MEKEIRFNDVPRWWALCFNELCAMKEHCLRHRVAAAVPATQRQALCVTPAASTARSCSMYVEATPVLVARGFDGAFQRLQSRDARHDLRLSLTRYFGSRGSYYRYKHGECILTPRQQQAVLSHFGRYGYQRDVFDSQYYDYCFEMPADGENSQRMG